MNAGDVAVEHEDLELAMAEYGKAADLLPDNVEVQYWAAVTLATSSNLEKALPMFERVFAADANWIELTKRLHKPGIIPDTDEGHRLVERIVAAAR
jgi:tetratricopeptide (TPR) repeat protein